MKQKSKVLLVFAIILSFVFLAFMPEVKASDVQKELYIVQNRKASNTAYRIAMDGLETDIWKIIEKTDNYDNNIYCIKGGPGFGNDLNDYVTAKTYTRRSNFKNVTETLATGFSNVLPKNELINNIKIKLDNGVGGTSYQKVSYNNYNAILWLVDNMYLPKLTKLSSDSSVNKTEMINQMKENLLKAAFSKYISTAPGAGTAQEQIGLTDDDIEVIQQLALWHFTNNAADASEPYKKYDIVSYTNDTSDSTKNVLYQTRMFNAPGIGTTTEEVIKIENLLLKSKTDTTYSSYSMASNGQIYAEILFTYLVHNAMIHSVEYVDYDTTDTDDIRNLAGKSPVEFENTTLTFFTQEGSTFVGPFKIKGNNTSIPYTLTTPVIKDQNGKQINTYSIYTSNGDGTITEYMTSSSITGDEIKTLVGKEFYIAVPESEKITGLDLNINGGYFETTADFWMVEGTNNEQPVIIIDKKHSPIELSKSSESNFDLALRKFITKVNNTELKDSTTGKYLREPNPEFVANYNNTGKGRFVYKHPKDESPVSVESGDIVTYTLRIYNEGKIDGYAKLISDDIPSYLRFIDPTDASNATLTGSMKTGYDTNKKYGWSTATVNGKTVIQTNYLSKENESNVTGGTLLRAFDEKTMEEPLYHDIEVAFEVIAPNSYKNLVVNTAEITDDSDRNGNPIDDIDSIPGDWDERGKDKDHNFTQDDIDKDYLKLKIFDLALRKFITDVTDMNGTALVNKAVKDGDMLLREPIVSIDSNKKITYTHPKTPVTVHSGERVVYTIRIYNEGETAGYAEEVTDFLPAGTEFLIEDPINTQYKWKIDSNNINIIHTNYLAYDENDSAQTNLLKAFGGTEDTLDYRDLKVAVRVTEPNDTDKEYLENIAEITEDKDKNGNPVEDIDSTPNNKDQDTRNTDGSFGEDDTDFERIRLEVFDLALRKFITEVNGIQVSPARTPVPEFVTNYNNTGKNRFVYKHPKDESPVSVATGDIVTYTLRIYNEGKMDGFAQSIFDDIPSGLEFLPDNETNKLYGWKQVTGGIATDYLSKEKSVDNLIHAFDSKTMQTPEYKDIKVAFRVIELNNSNRMLVNTAEIAEDADKNGNPVDDIDSIPNNKNEDGKDSNHNFAEDDIDKDYLILKQFDLALRKFITGVNETAVTDRIPAPEYVSNYNNTGKGRFVYKHKKDEAPVVVRNGDIVTYTLRLYNEGQIDGYAQSVYDNIPEGLEFLPDNEINKQYGWKLSADTKSVTTDYLSKEKALDNVILAFNSSTMNTPQYKDIKIAFKVIESNNSTRMIDNTAEIADEGDRSGNTTSKGTLKDIDSTPNDRNLDGKDKNHNFTQDDIDKDYIILRQFDLALRKFITAIGNQEITTRIPQPTIGEDGRIKYIHPKDPILVTNNSIITYTIRVYNEGTIDGYARTISDDVPEYLEFLPDNEINKMYGWQLSQDGKTLTTNYLSREKAVDNLLIAFDRGTMATPAYKDVKIAFKVTGQKLPDNQILINTAEIADDSDKDGKDIDDVDSIPNNKNEEGKDENHNFKEDDIDKEYVKVHYFDLSLLKWVNKVIVTVDGETTERETGYTPIRGDEGVVKQEINRKKIDSTIVKFEYTIRITNEGQIAGYAKEISDYIPEGLEFIAEDNPDWSIVDGKVTTRALQDRLLQPGETAEVKIILKWINNSENMGVKVNTAEISEDYNEYHAPDIDSTPNNKVPDEDDIDIASVALSTSTGSDTVFYFGLVGIILVAISGGVILIKRYVI